MKERGTSEIADMILETNIIYEAQPYIPYVTTLAVALLGLALTKRQREAILERDDNQGQMRHYNERDGWHTGGYCDDPSSCTHLNVHHISTQRNGGNDDPKNLITIYECEHNGRCPEGKVVSHLSKDNRRGRT